MKIGSENLRRSPTVSRLTVLLIAMLLIAPITTGCTRFLKTMAGESFNVALVDQLQVGVSTESDVRQLFGTPYGMGRTYLPFQQEQITLWSYYYELGMAEQQGNRTAFDARRTFMFVFINDGIYEGHMWFSSLPESRR
jgi:hypothetical protein